MFARYPKPVRAGAVLAGPADLVPTDNAVEIWLLIVEKHCHLMPGDCGAGVSAVVIGKHRPEVGRKRQAELIKPCQEGAALSRPLEGFRDFSALCGLKNGDPVDQVINLLLKVGGIRSGFGVAWNGWLGPAVMR